LYETREPIYPMGDAQHRRYVVFDFVDSYRCFMTAPKRYTREEDNVIRNYCQTKTAEEIGMMLGRPKNGVHHRIKKLGLSGRIQGEHHWKCKHSDLVKLAIGIMSDGGMTTGEIHRILTTPEDIKLHRVVDIAGGRQ